MDIQIIPYSKNFSEAHSTFAAKMWPTKQRRREAEYVRWKFRGPTDGDVEGFLLATVGRRVVGQLGLIPARLRVGETEYGCQWACDLVVDHEMRRRGIGTALFREGMARNVVTLGSDPSPAADKTMRAAGFRGLRGPYKMIFPLDVKHALQLKLWNRFAFFTPVLSWLARPVLWARSRTLSKQNSGEIDKGLWKEVVHRVRKKQEALALPHIIHDHSFLEWRCSGFEDYVPELRAFFSSSGTYAIVQATSEYYYVYDWYALSAEEAACLFKGVHQEAREAGSRMIMAYAQTAREEAMLKRVGFFSRSTRVLVLHYPARQLLGQERFAYDIYDSDGNL